MIRNANGDVSVPVRRGTGPRARVQAFLRAFDAYVEYAGDDRDEEERLYLAMVKARAEITGLLGAV